MFGCSIHGVCGFLLWICSRARVHMRRVALTLSPSLMHYSARPSRSTCVAAMRGGEGIGSRVGVLVSLLLLLLLVAATERRAVATTRAGAAGSD